MSLWRWFWPSLLLVLASCMCNRPKLQVQDDPPHVVLISLDTTRADALGPYAGPQAGTPHLDAFADEAVVFERHVSVAPTTLASHTSLMTGRYPLHHGVPRNAYYVHNRNLMLAEVLRDAGFATAAILGAMPLGEHSNFLQGFTHVDAEFRRPRSWEHQQAERTADAVTDAALAWLDGPRGDRVFLFVHYFDPHAPYEAPPPFGPGPSADGEGTLAAVAETRKRLQQGRGQRESRTLRELYQGEVRFVDQEVGRLLDGLKDRGILDDALIILTADHGETFDTHSDELWDHGLTVYDETVHTPLILRFPRGEHGGLRVPDLVANVDVFGTVTELLEMKLSPGDGLSLLPTLRGEALPERALFSEATKPWEPRNPDARWANDWSRKMVRVGDHKLHLDPRTGDRWLYDVSADPGELRDLASEEVERADALEAALQAWRASADPLPSHKVMAPDITAQLEALGYIE